MADSPVFDRTCEELQERTNLDRLEARGTVRLALKNAGLDAASVNAEQMGVVLRKVMPTELESRGIADASGVCDEIATAIADVQANGADDRAGAAAATISRFG